MLLFLVVLLQAASAQPQSNDRRALHWSLYVPSLLEMIRFAKGVLGMRILRSEDSEEKQRAYVAQLAHKRVRVQKIVLKMGHHYKAQKEAAPSRAKMMRLAQEMADFASALPCEYTNSVFVCVDEDRCDVLKVLITGVDGTPYASGCFEFDVICPAEYPTWRPR